MASRLARPSPRQEVLEHDLEQLIGCFLQCINAPPTVRHRGPPKWATGADNGGDLTENDLFEPVKSQTMVGQARHH